MNDGMQHDPIQGQGYKRLKVVKLDRFGRLSPPPFIMGAGK